jgi:hypothetical protein
MPKQEAKLKSAFFKELHRQLPGFLILAQASAGAPDKGIVGNGRVSFLEFKHATPQFISHGDQELFCMRLAVQGFCRYVIFWESVTGLGKRTMIVHPKQVHEREGWRLVPEEVTPGFDHRWLVEYVKQVHRVS